MPRKKERLSNLEWMDKHIAMNRNLVKELLKTSKVAYEVGNKTPLKLISIGYFTSVYTTIMNRYFKEWYYLDLFAGCGMNFIDNSEYFPGSPFVALEASKKNTFSKMLFVEKDPCYINALEERFKHIAKINDEYIYLKLENKNESICRFFNCDYKEFIRDTDFFSQLKSKKFDKHALVVIDPEGFEIGWIEFTYFLECKCDIFFSFMTGSIRREWGKARKGVSSSTSYMNNLFGGTEWKLANKSDDLVEIFCVKIKEYYPKKITIPISIVGENKSKIYHLIFITNKTKGNNPWLSSVHELKKRIESSGGKLVKASLNYLSGKRGRVEDWFLEKK